MQNESINHFARFSFSKLTQTAKHEVEIVISELVKKDPSRFIDFFNKAQPINTRIHQLELLPGIGKKHAEELVQKRNEKEFESFKDLKARVSLMPDPEKTIIKRIFMELKNEDKHRLFVQV